MNAFCKRYSLRSLIFEPTCCESLCLLYATRLSEKRTLESQVPCNKQRNCCTSLLRKEKRNYFGNTDTSKISDNKMFWKTVETMFSNKSVDRESVTLVKDDRVLPENLEVAETFNAFFLNIVKVLNISLGQKLLTEADHLEDPVLRILERFKKHPSVVAIFENHKDSAFSFKHVALDKIRKETKRLDMKKACQDTDIATKVIKTNSDIFADFFLLNLTIA